MQVDFLSAVKGGFFLRKNPLECAVPDYTNSESAIVAAPSSASKTILNARLASYHCRQSLVESAWKACPHGFEGLEVKMFVRSVGVDLGGLKRDLDEVEGLMLWCAR